MSGSPWQNPGLQENLNLVGMLLYGGSFGAIHGQCEGAQLASALLQNRRAIQP